MDLSTLKEAFRSHLQEACGCPIRWKSKADFAGPDGAASPSAVGYIRVTSGQWLGSHDEARWEGDKIRVYEHVLTKNNVTIAFESADGRDNYDALFYARKAENVLRRGSVSRPANDARFNVLPVGVREGPTLEDNGETLSTAVLEVVWSYEQITSSEVTNRLTGPGLTDLEAIETLDEAGKLEDIEPEGSTLTFGGSCTLAP